MSDRSGVFLCYSLEDGAVFASVFRAALESEGIFVAPDLLGDQGQPDSKLWDRMTQGIDSANVVVVLVTTAYLQSGWIEKVWRYARHHGVTTEIVEFFKNEHLRTHKAHKHADYWERIYWKDSVYTTRLGDVPDPDAMRTPMHMWDHLISKIRTPQPAERRPYMIEEQARYIERPLHDITVFHHLLYVDRVNFEGLKLNRNCLEHGLAFWGREGVGKTTLARAACGVPNIEAEFSNGMLWVTLGDSATMETIRIKVNGLISAFSGTPSDLELEAAIAAFNALLESRFTTILLVVDDVCTAEHLRPFLQLGSGRNNRIALIITTRYRELIPPGMVRELVGALTDDEAFALLTQGLNLEMVARRRPELQALCARAEYHAGRLDEINRWLREPVNAAGQFDLKAVEALISASEYAPFQAATTETEPDLISRIMSLDYLAQRTLLEGTAAVQRELQAAAEAARQGQHPQANAVELLRRAYGAMSALLHRCSNEQDAVAVLHARLSPIDAFRPDCVMSEARWKPFITQRYPLPDVPNPAIIHTLVDVHALAFSPDGRYLVGVRPESPQALVFDTNTAKHVLTLSGHGDTVTRAAYSPDGRWIVTSSQDETLKLWNPETGMAELTLTGHTAAVKYVAFSPDGQRVVSAGDDGTVRVWELSTGVEKMTLTGHEKPVWHASYSPDGLRIVSTGQDQTVKLWLAYTGEEVLSFPRGNCFSLEFNPRGQAVIMTTQNRGWYTGVIEFDVSHPDIRVRELLVGNEQMFFGGCAAISPDGRWLLGSTDRFGVRILDMDTGEQVGRIKGLSYFSKLMFSPDGRILVSTRENLTQICDAALLLRSSTSIPFAAKCSADQVRCGAVSSDGRWIVTGMADGTAQVWNAHDGSAGATLVGHTGDVWCAAFRHDGYRIVTGSRDHTLKVWDTDTGKTLLVLGGHTDGVLAVIYTPNGANIISTSRDKTARIWDANSGELVDKIEGLDSFNSAFALDAAGNRLAVVREDNELLLRALDAKTDQLSTLDRPSNAWCTCIAFSPDGNLLAAGWDNGMITVFAPDAPNNRLRLVGHTEPISAVTFSPDGCWILSGSRDTTLKIWDAISGDCLSTFYGTAAVVNCAWTGDGEGMVAVTDTSQIIYRLRWLAN